MYWYICFPNLRIFIWESSLSRFKFLHLCFFVNASHSYCILCDYSSKDPVLSLMVFIFLLFRDINLPCQELSGKICYSSPLQISRVTCFWKCCIDHFYDKCLSQNLLWQFSCFRGLVFWILPKWMKDLILFVPSCSNKKMYVGQTLHCCKFPSNNRISLCIMRPLAIWMLRSNDLRFTYLCKEAF